MRLSVLLVVLAGCAAEEKDTGSDLPPVDQNTDTDEPCDGTAPVLTELTVGDLGEPYEFEGTPGAALLVAATGEDEDGDLHRMAMTYWYDDVVDGVVDTSVPGTESTYIAMNDEQECATSRATYKLVFEVDGSRFAYETAYEFAAEVYDAAGLVSGQVVASGVTPGPL